MLFECVVIALTWFKTADILNTLKIAAVGARKGPAYLLLRDGTTYFVTLLLLNTLSLLSIRVEAFNNMPTLIDTLTSILISRFMLDLRHDFVSREGSTSMSLHMSEMSDVEFAAPASDRFIGNLGAAVGRDRDYYDYDESRGAKRSKLIEVKGGSFGKKFLYQEA